MTRDDVTEHPATTGAEHLRRIAVRVFGEAPAEVLPTDRPSAHQVVLDDGRRALVKMATPGLPPGRTLVEAWAYERARAAGVPAPAVLGVSERDDPVEFVVAEWIDGPTADHVPAERRDGLIEATGAHLRALHTVVLDGYGYVDAGRYLDTGEIRGGAEAWCPMVGLARSLALPYLSEHRLIDPAVADRVSERLDAHAGVLNGAVASHLLHGDMHSWHILAAEDGSTVRALIDFGDLTVGDPVWDLARFALYEPDEAVARMADGYGRDAITDDDLAVKVPLYRVSAAAVVAAWAHRSGYAQAVPRVVQAARFAQV